MWWPASQPVPIHGDHTERVCRVMAGRPCAIAPISCVRRRRGAAQPPSADLGTVIRR